MIQSVVVSRFMRAIPHAITVIFQVISALPFSTKNAIFSPMKENKKFTNVFTRKISELAALKLVMS